MRQKVYFFAPLAKHYFFGGKTNLALHDVMWRKASLSTRQQWKKITHMWKRFRSKCVHEFEWTSLFQNPCIDLRKFWSSLMFSVQSGWAWGFCKDNVANISVCTWRFGEIEGCSWCCFFSEFTSQGGMVVDFQGLNVTMVVHFWWVLFFRGEVCWHWPAPAYVSWVRLAPSVTQTGWKGHWEWKDRWRR